MRGTLKDRFLIARELIGEAKTVTSSSVSTTIRIFLVMTDSYECSERIQTSMTMIVTDFSQEISRSQKESDKTTDTQCRA